MSCAAAPESVKDDVKEYYGKVLEKTADLKTGACLMGAGPSVPQHVKQAMALVHPEVDNRYYGCGLVVPEVLQGMSVLDLGSGAGRDCFILSKLVGENGHVTGIDMTDEQLAVAWKYEDYHRETFGYKSSNVNFVKGYIELLTDAGLKENSFDMIISNCVVNLSPDKRAVIKEAHKVLKEGGEIYFSDVYADRDLPEDVRKHKVLWGECISGALFWDDLLKLAHDTGFSRPRLVTSNSFPIEQKEFKNVLGDAKFVSATYRLFKLPNELQTPSQATYKGNIEGYRDGFKFDNDHYFKTGEPMTTCAELSTILQSSRFKDAFTFTPSTCGDCKDLVDPFEFVRREEEKGVKPVQSCCQPKSSGESNKCC